MGRWLKLGVAAVLITATALFGFMGNKAQAANALCPKTCLTVGALVGGSTRALHAESVSRDFNYSWTALDLTEQLPQIYQIAIHLYATGYVSKGTFYGVGDVMLTPTGEYYGTHYAHVRVTDNGTAVHMSGGGFTLNALNLIGAGTAQYKQSYDYDWDYCGEC